MNAQWLHYIYSLGNHLGLLPFVGIAVMVFAMAYYLIVRKERVSGWAKIVLPFAMGILLFLHVAWIESIMGRPVEGYPPGIFTYLFHREIIVDGQREIELWIVDEHGFSRLYVFKWDGDASKELGKMKKRQKQGSRPQGEFKRGPSGSGQDSQPTLMTPQKSRNHTKGTPDNLNDNNSLPRGFRGGAQIENPPT